MIISVIIPCFNRVHTLPRALDSVFNQTLMPTEVILVDDGSTDDTADLVRARYPACRYLYQENRGVSAARNRGIAESSGEWIALLDSDDAWLPDKLEAQRRELARQPQRRLCHTDEIWVRNGTRVNPMTKHAKSGGYIYRHCLPRCVISPSSVLLQRSLLEQVGGFDENLPACEDYDLWLRVCAREAVSFVSNPLTIKYGGHDDQLSRLHWGMDRFRVRALEKLIEAAVLDDDDRAAAVRVLLQKTEILAQGAAKRGHMQRADYYRNKHMHFRAQFSF